MTSIRIITSNVSEIQQDHAMNGDMSNTISDLVLSLIHI